MVFLYVVQPLVRGLSPRCRSIMYPTELRIVVTNLGEWPQSHRPMRRRQSSDVGCRSYAPCAALIAAGDTGPVDIAPVVIVKPSKFRVVVARLIAMTAPLPGTAIQKSGNPALLHLMDQFHFRMGVSEPKRLIVGHSRSVAMRPPVLHDQ